MPSSKLDLGLSAVPHPQLLLWGWQEDRSHSWARSVST